MAAVTFLALVQSQLIHAHLTCSPRAMTLKTFLIDSFETNVALLLRRLYGFCGLLVGLRRFYDFLRTYTSLHVNRLILYV